MDRALRRLVIERAGGFCEYCRFPEPFRYLDFEIDHVIAQKHGGPTAESNLAWACYNCNSYKGPNIAGWISESGQVVRLFHPRTDVWADHFEWHGPLLVGRTDIGNATIQVLMINHADAVEVRRWLIASGVRLPSA
jgi:hypothetical protein